MGFFVILRYLIILGLVLFEKKIKQYKLFELQKEFKKYKQL